MKNREQVESFLLAFSICTILYCVLFAFIIGEERRNYEKRINEIQKTKSLTIKN